MVSRQRQNCQEIGFLWVVAHNGSGILYMQGNIYNFVQTASGSGLFPYMIYFLGQMQQASKLENKGASGV